MNNKRIIILVLFVSSLALMPYTAKAAGNDGIGIDNNVTIADTLPQPDIRFEEYVFDFGDISRSRNTKRTHAFVFENNGNANLIILHAASGCGCTVPKYTKDPVKPGKKGKIDVTFNAKDRQLGSFTKSVTVYFNSVKSYVRIFIKGKVVE